MKNIWILVGIAGLGLVARADSLDNDLKAFTEAVNASDAAKKSANPDMAYRLSAMTNELTSVMQMPGGEANMENTVRQVMATNSSSDVQKAGKALLTDLETRRKARVEAIKAKVDEVLKHATEILAKAQKTQDLDGLLSDLQKAQTNRGGYDQESQAQMGRLTTAYQFVAQWQDYLSARNSGNITAAQQALQNLLNRNGEISLVPRSEILARNVQLAAGAKPAASGTSPSSPQPVDESAIIAGIRSLDDLDTAAKAVKAANPNIYSQTSNDLLQIAGAYAASKAGLPPTLQLAPNSNFTSAPEIERVRAMLLMYLLPRYLGPKAVPANPNEAVADYLNRSVDDAANRQDWELLQRIIIAKTRISRSQYQESGSRVFLAALNQEMAGQYAQAVVSYNNALSQPDEFLPARVAGDRLAAIKKDHPAEYEEGMKTVANPPSPSYMNPMMMRAMMMQGYPMPGVPGAVNAGRGPTPPPGGTPAATNASPTAVTPPAGTNAAPGTPAK